MININIKRIILGTAILFFASILFAINSGAPKLWIIYAIYMIYHLIKDKSLNVPLKYTKKLYATRKNAFICVVFYMLFLIITFPFISIDNWETLNILFLIISFFII